MIDAYRDAGGRGKAAPPGAPELGAGRGRGAARSPTTSGAPTSSPAAAAGTSNSSSTSTSREHVPPESGRTRPSTSRPTSGSTRRGSRSTPSSGSTRSTCTTSARSRRRSSTCSATKVLPQLEADRTVRLTQHRRPVVEERGRLLPGRRDLPRQRRRRRGDFAGLTQRIDHLAELGVTCLWLMPFYPTPDRDDGYDITDFYGVDPRLGTLRRPRRVRPHRARPGHAGDRGPGREPHLRPASVVPECPQQPRVAVPGLVRLARTSRRRTGRRAWCSRTRSTASGSTTRPPSSTTCTGSTSTSRTSTSRTRRCATRSPASIGFWLQLGLSGFRVDAVPFLLETAGQDDAEQLPDPHDYLRDLRAVPRPAQR